jgi:uncharacterized membrane protein YhaH (DUF805 family)
MSWSDVLFGFHGRITRKTYWLGAFVITIAGLAFNALLSYLATGSLFSPAVWERPADQISVWFPVWAAYLALLAWPATALGVKRLHDRNRPAWIWYIYYAGTIVLTLIPAKGVSGPSSLFFDAILIFMAGFGLYLLFELGILRGTRGANQYGEDRLPADYHGGDYNIWSWMLALEGRISRSQWWLGFIILMSVTIGLLTFATAVVSMFASEHPELQQKLADPAWINSPEAAPILFKLGLWAILPSLLFLLVLWSLVALSVKRLHDRGLSSWLILILVLPFLAVLFAPAFAQGGESPIHLASLLFLASVIWSILQFGIFKGEVGSNSHGPDPLAGQRL